MKMSTFDENSNEAPKSSPKVNTSSKKKSHRSDEVPAPPDTIPPPPFNLDLDAYGGEFH
jgi:hypothetical protein